MSAKDLIADMSRQFTEAMDIATRNGELAKQAMDDRAKAHEALLNCLVTLTQINDALGNDHPCHSLIEANAIEINSILEGATK